MQPRCIHQRCYRRLRLRQQQSGRVAEPTSSKAALATLQQPSQPQAGGTLCQLVGICEHPRAQTQSFCHHKICFVLSECGRVTPPYTDLKSSKLRPQSFHRSSLMPLALQYPIRAAIASIVQIIQDKRALASIAHVSILHCKNC